MIGILGGGLTGLTLGSLIKKRNYSFEILEGELKCGGLMRSLQDSGFTFDVGGSHIVFSKDKEVLDYICSLLGNNIVKNRRNTKIFYDGCYVKYPFENGLSDLPKEENYECLYKFTENFIRREKGELEKPKNLRDWCYYTFGEGIAEKYLIPYNNKIWKYHLDKMSLEWVERIPNPPIEDVIKSSLGIETEGYLHQLCFYYPKYGGIQSIIDSLFSELQDSIISGFEVKDIKQEDGMWIVSNGNIEKEYHRILSTIPIHDLIRALKNVPEYVKKAVDDLEFRSLVTVMIGVDIHKINNISWLYIPNEDILTHRVSFPSNYSKNVVPRGKSSILAEITDDFGGDIWNMKDEEIIDIVIEDLHKLGIVYKDKIVYTNLWRFKYAYVINNLNYRSNIELVGNYLARLGIDLVGRFAEFSYLNMDGCIKSAIDYSRSMEII